ncbi:unnamed protein product [Urochloa decumbens]|uniref:F-box domain-containing protein n=1 Tax=Urochloa decumbens TaxID=240449 RepID=A0ABC9GD28_9POAL
MDDSECSAMARLPNDAIVEIHSRHNAKSLCRSKCVSKPWRDLIADRLHCKNLPQTLQGFLYFDGGNWDVNDNGDLVISSSSKKLPRPNYGHFINMLGESVPFLDSSFTFMKEQLDDVEGIRVLDSCNGLLLFGPRWGSDSYDSEGYIVCNPVTEQWVAVPSSGLTPPPPEETVDKEDSVNDVRTFLLFDPSVSSHFYLVQFWQDEYRENVEGVRTYSSESGLWSDRSSEWRQRENEDGGRWTYYGVIGSPLRGRAFVNGMLHFLFYRFAQDEFDIIAVDGQGKTCKVISWPNKYQLFHNNACFIGQSQGSLHCISVLGKQKVECNDDLQLTGLSIWVLEDYDTEEWVLKHCVSFLQLFGTKICLSPFAYVAVAFHPDRNLVFFVDQRDLISFEESRLISYNMDSREVCVLCTLGQVRSRMTLYVPCFESLALGYKH